MSLTDPRGFGDGFVVGWLLVLVVSVTLAWFGYAVLWCVRRRRPAPAPEPATDKAVELTDTHVIVVMPRPCEYAAGAKM